MDQLISGDFFHLNKQSPPLITGDCFGLSASEFYLASPYLDSAVLEESE